MDIIELRKRVQELVSDIYSKKKELQPQYDALNAQANEVHDKSVREIESLCEQNGVGCFICYESYGIKVHLSFSENVSPEEETLTHDLDSR